VNDVRDICERLLDEPAPPARDAEQVLGAARRSARRARLAVAGSGVAALAVVAVGAGLVVPGAPWWSASPGGAVGGVGTARSGPPSAVVQPPPEQPPARASAAHGRQMDRVLMRAVPPGVTGRSRTMISDNTTVYPPPKPGEGILLAAHAWVRMEADGREGELLATIMVDGKPDRTGDLCAAQPDAAQDDPAQLSCEVLDVGGVPVRVTTERDAERGLVVVGTRFLRGGFLMVSSAQGVPVYEPETDLPPDAPSWRKGEAPRKPPLTAPPLTAYEVAVIAADPAMLP
jgi:hypothetical protein